MNSPAPVHAMNCACKRCRPPFPGDRGKRGLTGCAGVTVLLILFVALPIAMNFIAEVFGN